MIIEDPNDKKNLTGFFHLAPVYSPNVKGHLAGSGALSGTAVSAPLAVRSVVKAINRYTDLRADVIEAIPYNSAGTRVHLWAFGLQKFVERPVFGHGPYNHHLIIASDLQNKHGYLHNSYLEMLVRLGLFGAPSFLVGRELFWGHDRLEDAIAWAEGEMQ